MERRATGNTSCHRYRSQISKKRLQLNFRHKFNSVLRGRNKRFSTAGWRHNHVMYVMLIFMMHKNPPHWRHWYSYWLSKFRNVYWTDFFFKKKVPSQNWWFGVFFLVFQSVKFNDRIDRIWSRFFLNLLRRPEKSKSFFFFSRRSEINDRCWSREDRADVNVELFLFLFIYCVKLTFLFFLNTKAAKMLKII